MKRFVLLDRDGTVIVDKHYLRDPAQVVLLSGAAEGLARMAGLGLGLVLVTNQSGVGRGYFDEESVRLVHERLRAMLEREGVRLEGVYHCPHAPEEGCGCRKPQPGMIRTAARDLGFAANQAFVVGDKACDVELGRAVGAATILARTGKGARTEAEGKVHPDYVADDLRDAASWIERRLGER